jgi:glycosyltransferase involved in cell wall biosynthesis
MNIGIDARLYGLEHAGLGRYVKQLVDGLIAKHSEHHYTLFVRPKYAHHFADYPHVKLVVTRIPIYSLSEQILLPLVFLSQPLSILHVPHFNAPILYPGPFVLTIHDLIKDSSTGKSTTTRSQWLYTLKRLGYLFLRQVVTWRARHILVPTKHVRQILMDRLGLKKDKITVTYEAVGSQITKLQIPAKDQARLLSVHSLSRPFVVYTGSVYPHKNVNFLVSAIVAYNRSHKLKLGLAVICARSVFYDRLKRYIARHRADKYVKLLGYLDDIEVSQIYSLALALVHPSKMEGFGLTGLEAMQAGLSVLSSSASCLPEVYGDSALYFDPESKSDLIAKLNIIQGDTIRQEMIEKGYKQAKKYSWDKLVKKTICVYQRV